MSATMSGELGPQQALGAILDETLGLSTDETQLLNTGTFGDGDWLVAVRVPVDEFNGRRVGHVVVMCFYGKGPIFGKRAEQLTQPERFAVEVPYNRGATVQSLTLASFGIEEKGSITGMLPSHPKEAELTVSQDPARLNAVAQFMEHILYPHLPALSQAWERELRG